MAAQGSLECYLSKTYSNILEIITKTKLKQPHAHFPGTLPSGKDSVEKEMEVYIFKVLILYMKWYNIS